MDLHIFYIPIKNSTISSKLCFFRVSSDFFHTRFRMNFFPRSRPNFLFEFDLSFSLEFFTMFLKKIHIKHDNSTVLIWVARFIFDKK